MGAVNSISNAMAANSTSHYDAASGTQTAAARAHGKHHQTIGGNNSTGGDSQFMTALSAALGSSSSTTGDTTNQAAGSAMASIFKNNLNL
ncbi:MAG TPA: hypothetical protein VGG19_13120 [Tepidisphaeraceae bacterium]|jgi:hypothetical protein